MTSVIFTTCWQKGTFIPICNSFVDLNCFTEVEDVLDNFQTEEDARGDAQFCCDLAALKITIRWVTVPRKRAIGAWAWS